MAPKSRTQIIFESLMNVTAIGMKAVYSVNSSEKWFAKYEWHWKSPQNWKNLQRIGFPYRSTLDWWEPDVVSSVAFSNVNKNQQKNRTPRKHVSSAKQGNAVRTKTTNTIIITFESKQKTETNKSNVFRMQPKPGRGDTAVHCFGSSSYRAFITE